MPKSSNRKNQLVDAQASKHVKIIEPEVAFDHAEETEAIHSFAQEWMQALYTRAHTHSTKLYTYKDEKNHTRSNGLYKP